MNLLEVTIHTYSGLRSEIDQYLVIDKNCVRVLDERMDLMCFNGKKGSLTLNEN